MCFVAGHGRADRVKITALRDQTNLLPLLAKVKSKSLKLFGHIKRSKTGLSKLCLEGKRVDQHTYGVTTCSSGQSAITGHK